MWLLNEWQRPLGSSMPLICWRCDAPMKIKVITPAMSSAPLGEIVYRSADWRATRKRSLSPATISPFAKTIRNPSGIGRI